MNDLFKMKCKCTVCIVNMVFNAFDVDIGGDFSVRIDIKIGCRGFTLTLWEMDSATESDSDSIPLVFS